MTLGGSMNQNEFKNSFRSSTSINKSERIIKEEPLPGILNHPVPQTLHGDRDYDYLEQKEPQKTVISSSVTQEDIEFYDQLEEKKEKSWKRRLKQDEEFKRELEKIKSREELLYNLEDNLEDSKNKLIKKPKSYFQEEENKNKIEVKVTIKTKNTKTNIVNVDKLDNQTNKETYINLNKQDNKTESKIKNLLLEGYSSEDD